MRSNTAEKIREAMEYYDYVPQGNTGKVASREVRRVGVFVPFFPAPSFVQRLEGMLPVFRAHNYEMIVYTIENDEQLDEYTRSVPFTRRLDGIVLMSINLDEVQRRTILSSGLPTVCIENRDPGFSHIYIDSVIGGRLAARLFMQKQLYPCAFLGDTPEHRFSLQPSRERLEGFREELALGGYILEEEDIYQSVPNFEDARRVAKGILSSVRRPRAIFAMSDIQAIGVYHAAVEMGLRIPDDLALLGFDNIAASGWMGISTIDQYLVESGRVAATTLVERIKDPKWPFQSLQLGLSLLERKTT